jgi:hypothetical protein
MNDTLRTFGAGKGKTGFHYSLPALGEKGLGEDIPPPGQYPDRRRHEGGTLASTRKPSPTCVAPVAAMNIQVQLVPELGSELAERSLKPTAGSVYHFSST